MRCHSRTTNSAGITSSEGNCKSALANKTASKKPEMALMPPLTAAFKIPLICFCHNIGGKTRAVWTNDDLKAQWNSFVDRHVTVLNCFLKVKPYRTH